MSTSKETKVPAALRHQKNIESQQLRFCINSIIFSDDTKLELDPDTILIVTGPNNSGKSVLLSEIFAKITSDQTTKQVTNNVELNIGFGFDDLLTYAKERWGTRETLRGDVPFIDLHFANWPTSSLRNNWPQNFVQVGGGRIFTLYLTTATRLQLANSESRIDYPNVNNVALTPLQRLDAEADGEDRLSEIFKAAFGIDLIVNRQPGTQVHLHVGSKSGLPGYEKANRKEYADEIAKRPQLANQGDGMKSFAGILLQTLIDPKSIILLDEPEAFLHPPQIRKLASVLAREIKSDTQVIVATHSEAFIHGLLDANFAPRIKVVRLLRDGKINRVAQLEKEKLSSIWTHPLLRYSELLSGLFYDVAIICEGDSDCRFFQAVIDRLVASLGETPDLRFFHVGGKDRLHLAISALRAIKTPVLSIVDIDIINNHAAFKRVVEAAGGNFAEFEADYKVAVQPTLQKNPDASARAVKEKMDSLFGTLDLNRPLQKKEIQSLESAIKFGDRWKTVKRIGRAALGSGETLRAFDRMVEKCRDLGLLINVYGELESFCRIISSDNKSDWLSEVLDLDPGEDQNLSEAREFTKYLLHAAKKTVTTASS